MTHRPWRHPWRVACLLAGSVLGCSALAQPTPPLPDRPAARALSSSTSLAQAFEAAWARSPAAAESGGRQRQAQAQQALASAWLADNPAVELAQRTGRGPAAEGSRERELGLSLPLWRPGQRQRQAERAQADADWAAAGEQAARLQLAGQVREQAVRLHLSRLDAEHATRQREWLAQLSADVARRVKAGDLAPTDAMAAQAELLGAQALEQEAALTWARQRSDWAVLTGLHELPELETTALPEADTVPTHAEARLAEVAVQRAQAHLASTQAQSAAPLELGLGVRQERDGPGQPRQNSVGVSLRIPIGMNAHSRPRVADAMAELDLAVAHQQRVQQQLAADLAMARADLAARGRQAEAEATRAALLRQRAALLDQSFRAGESSLPDLLRALSGAAQAESAAARQHIALQQARARLLQALGQLP